MKLVRYNQSGADFYGAEGEIYFKPTPRYRIGLSGDYVRGRLKNLPSLPGREDAYGNRPTSPKPTKMPRAFPPHGSVST